MSTPIWQATAGTPVDIQINIDQAGQGWFTLTVIAANGAATDLKRTDSQDADGDAFFRVTPGSDLLFKLQVLCASAAAPPGSGVWLRALQGGNTLPCYDTSANLINQGAGGGYEPVSLGTITQGQNLTFNFDVWA